MVKEYNTVEARRSAVADVPLSQVISSACRDIDAAAERARLAYLTGGAGQALVYERKRAEAEGILRDVASGDVWNENDYPLAQARAARLGVEVWDVAAEWSAQATAWLAIAAAIENAREGGKEAVKAAADLAVVETARDAALAALAAIEGAAG